MSGLRADTRAWGIWLLASLAVLFVADNPWADVVVAACAAVAAATAVGPSPFRQLVLVGVAAAALRTLLFALTGHGGETTLAELPTLDLPVFLGGATFGGRVTAETVATGLTEGARLVAVMACIGAFLAVTETIDVVRLVPRFLFEAALVVNIAVAFAPQLARAARDAREAQRARGGRMGFRAVPALVVPVLASALERSIGLAESMDSRGYGRPAGPARAEGLWRAAAAVAGLAAAGAASLWATGIRTGLAAPAAAAAVAILGACLAKLSRLVPRTRYRHRRWGPADRAIGAGALVSLAAVALLARAPGTGPGTGPLPPPPPPPVAAALATLALPGVLALGRRREEAP